jgi:hypothetical protein
LSKRSKPTKSQKRHKKIVFYLDRNLCCERLIQPLKEAGYDLVTYFDDYGRVHNQQVADPEIIARCGARKHILITADKKLEYQYAPEIHAARIGVVLLLTNNGGVNSWCSRLVTAQPAIREQIRNRRKPYLMRVSLDGTLTIIKLYRKPKDKVLYLY